MNRRLIVADQEGEGKNGKKKERVNLEGKKGTKHTETGGGGERGGYRNVHR